MFHLNAAAAGSMHGLPCELEPVQYQATLNAWPLHVLLPSQ
jgi:hypothetical protein